MMQYIICAIYQTRVSNCGFGSHILYLFWSWYNDTQILCNKSRTFFYPDIMMKQYINTNRVHVSHAIAITQLVYCDITLRHRMSVHHDSMITRRMLCCIMVSRYNSVVFSYHNTDMKHIVVGSCYRYTHMNLRHHDIMIHDLVNASRTVFYHDSMIHNLNITSCTYFISWYHVHYMFHF